MLSTVLSLAALGIAAAAAAAPLGSTVDRRQGSTDPSDYPPYTTGPAFRLVANVTNLTATAITPSIHLWYVQGQHSGAGIDTMTLINAAGQVFWVNGTELEVRYSESTVQSDSALFPMGLMLTEDAPYGLWSEFGPGREELGVTPFPRPTPMLYGPDQGTFVACNETFDAYAHPVIGLGFATATFDNATATFVQAVPDNCVPVNLLPECADLAPPPEGANYTHDFAQPVRCYPNVSALDWSHSEAPWRF